MTAGELYEQAGQNVLCLRQMSKISSTSFSCLGGSPGASVSAVGHAIGISEIANA